MSDGQVADVLGGEQQQQQQQQPQQQQQQQPPPQEQQQAQVPEWMNGFAPELQADPDINRYKTAEDAAKAIKEIRAWGRGRIPLPAADDEAGWVELGSKLRAEKPEDYNFEVPAGEDPGLANEFKQFAFDTGLPPRWAEGTVKWFNQRTEALLSKLAQDNVDDLKSVEIEFGPAGYAQRIEAVNKMFAAAGIEGMDVANGLQHMLAKGPDGAPKASAAATMKALFTLAEKTGELGKVDPLDVNLRLGLRGDDAAAAARAMVESTDPEMIRKMADPTSAERKRYNQLMEAARRKG